MLFILLCNGACNKNNNSPESGGTLLSEVRSKQQIDGNTLISNDYYNYNSNNQLISHTNGQDTTLFGYNNQGKLIVDRLSNQAVGPIYTDSFVYDTQGRIIKKMATPLMANLAVNDHSYSYDINNNLVVDSVHNGNKPDIANYMVYEYNVEGNISKEFTYLIINGITKLDYTVQNNYNDKVNPYFQSRLALYFGEDFGSLALSKNVIIDSGGPFIPKYSYYSNGIIKNITYNFTQIGSQSIGTVSVDFIYRK